MLFRLDESITFPHPSLANTDGLLAIGGDLSPERLLLAYQWGIFPWFNEGEQILWWCPQPRFMLIPEKVKVAKSMRAYFNQNKYTVTFDTSFAAVMEGCRNQPRSGQQGTWVTDDIIHAYTQLHRLGVAHSVEVWHNNTLAGGLYGVSLGKIFFGESMFAREPNASKFGFITLCRWLAAHEFWCIDCQIHSEHLATLGAAYISSSLFMDLINKNQQQPTLQGSWETLL
ncbi:MAG: leucyl/phenylalanyl-tRNA--protein transferase [Saprospiraceae bacterium]|nr:leucyl/phenylalanyl-tRNA--protein transferase [Saprospiraceae bacterium]MBP7679601.1 leucyl/phenylalanyl-tRNA--protein transferase [Saprospiraceae bacterium]